MDPYSLLYHFYYILFQVDAPEWHDAEKSSSTSPSKVLFDIDTLIPKTKYAMKLILTYREKGVTFLWPRASSFKFTTKGDVPSSPGKPQLKLGRDKYEVFWDKSTNYGYDEIIYELEQRYLPSWKFVCVCSL